MNTPLFLDRELSWLAFNGRVLQEAADPTTPLYERITFLAIFSSNLDEYFRVRVASIRSLLSLKQKSAKKLEFDPEEHLKAIHATVKKQQAEFGEIFRSIVVPGLRNAGVEIVSEKDLTPEQLVFVEQYFQEHVLPAARPLFLGVGEGVPFLENKMLYLACALTSRDGSATAGKHKRTKDLFALVPIPANASPRFITLPKNGDTHCIMFLDDIVRSALGEIFPRHEVTECYSIKVTRDAELYIDDEFTGDLLDKIKKALHRRKTGVPSRFLYDGQMPAAMLKYLRTYLDINKSDSMPGGRYHNFSDFFSFPNPGIEGVSNEPLHPLVSTPLMLSADVFATLLERDIMLYYPYHSYHHVVHFVREAAWDPRVSQIDITLYRVAHDSEICLALIAAAQRGKTVNAFIEVKARFDEESNFTWAEALSKSGVKTHFSIPGLKVHGKVLVVTREEAGSLKRYAYLSTGNFNEHTAQMYTDFGYFTADQELANEAYNSFQFIIDRNQKFKFKRLLVAQVNMREELNACIKREIKNARNGKPASILLKFNSLEDPKLIRKLYDASCAGVSVEIICRGICCLIPGVKNLSENISVTSIVDRFLEHARVYVFHNGGEERMFLSSADWMTRNLDRRIEIAFPVTNPIHRAFIHDVLSVQLRDNVKARVLTGKHSNAYKKAKSGELPVRSQIAIHERVRLWEEREEGTLPAPMNHQGKPIEA